MHRELAVLVRYRAAASPSRSMSRAPAVLVADVPRPVLARRQALAEVVHQRREAHRRVGRQLGRDLEHLHGVHAGVDLRDATSRAAARRTARRSRETPPPVRRSRAAPRSRPRAGLAERALRLHPDALRHQRAPSRRDATMLRIRVDRLGRDRESERREARGEARDAQHAQRILDERRRHVTQHPRLEVAAAAVRIDELARRRPAPSR